MVLMTALELIQLTRIPAHLFAKDNVILRTIARLLGTEFSFLDRNPIRNTIPVGKNL